MSEQKPANNAGNKAKRLRKWERLFLFAGLLLLGLYLGAKLYSSAYQAYAGYLFEEQLQGRTASIKGFVTHLFSKTRIAARPQKRQVNGDDLLRNMVYAPQIVQQGKGWSADRLRDYRRAASPSSGSILGRLEIPSLGLSVMLLQGTSEWTLNRAVGHIEGTAFPGQSGNLGIAGHRDGFFRCLKDITKNTSVVLTTLKGRYYYRVNGIHVVTAKDTKVLAPTAKPTLTLVTCYPFYYIGNAPKRYIVTAEIVKTESPRELAAAYNNAR